MVCEITINFNIEKIVPDFFFSNIEKFSYEDFINFFEYSDIKYHINDLKYVYEIINEYSNVPYTSEEKLERNEELEHFFKVIIESLKSFKMHQIRCIYKKDKGEFMIYNPIELKNFSLFPPDYLELAIIPEYIVIFREFIKDLFLNNKEEIENLICKYHETSYFNEYTDFTLTIKRLRKYKHLCFILENYENEELFYYNKSFYLLGELEYNFDYYDNYERFPPESLLKIFLAMGDGYMLVNSLKYILKNYDEGFFELNEGVRLIVYKDIVKLSP